jgi:hypothetical protein
MKLTSTLVFSLWLGMTAVLVYGFGFGDFTGEGAKLLAMPWGIVSLADLYTGFWLFAGWIIYRERSVLNKVLWIIALMILGNWLACLYVLLALRHSQGDTRRFWLGASR